MTDDQTTTTPAVAGPWIAVLDDGYGHIINAPESVAYVDSARVSVMRNVSYPAEG